MFLNKAKIETLLGAGLLQFLIIKQEITNSIFEDRFVRILIIA